MTGDVLGDPAVTSQCAWTTVNIAEVFPGIPTPLTWSFHEDGFELGLHGAFNDIGVLPATAVRVADHPDERVCALFNGRPFMNVDRFRLFADLMPGTNGDVMERQIFGNVRPGVPLTPPNPWRYPVIAAKMPKAALGVTRRLEQDAAELHRWWKRTATSESLRTADAATEVLRDAVARFAAVFRPHCLAMLIGQGLFEQVLELCSAAKRPELGNDLIGGDLVELDMLGDLWNVSRGQLSLDAFVTEYGYHGPNDGELINRTWREDPSSLEALVATYASMDEADGPAGVHGRRRVRRAQAEGELLAALSPPRRLAARVVLPLARKVIPYREIGKDAFLHTVDAARAAARVIGADLARRHLLAEEDDVFMLTVDELLAHPARPLIETVASRRERWDHCAAQQYPALSQGVPTPLSPSSAEPAWDGTLAGLAVSPGRRRGRARIVRDPAESDLEPGDILVCPATDPGWITLFLVASAVVIDIGGPMSHGAIVARELGIPSVINTVHGTRLIPDGATIDVDGDAGTVTMVT
jgi:phosphohistidine swiveling domain-containing protein